MNRLLKRITLACVMSLITVSNIPYVNMVHHVNAATEEKQDKQYTLVSTKKLDEIGATSYVYTHIKSGAKIIFLKNNDKNKFFSISFRTTANDNKGENHIIEHSVLCGSKKYPVKSPFNQMAKQSMSTFLNALTSDDMTMYPVGSKNNNDFKNLVDVYMDAVFHPNLIKEKNIFKQEGWHFELNSAKDELKANGTVYNEMNGYETNSSNIMEETKKKVLFPDTYYKYNSGGDPKDILNLSYDELLKTYKKNYTPSNSYIFFYGDVNIDEMLKYMDKDYLSEYTKEKVDVNIPVQTPFKAMKLVESSYGIGKNDSEKNKTYITFNYKLTNALDKETNTAFSILKELLLGSESSPLRKAFLDNGINLAGATLDSNTYQPVFTISVLNTEASEKTKIQKIINDTLNDIIKKGFDKKYFTQCFNKYELQKKQSVYKSDTVGLDYAQNVTMSWLFGGSPELYLTDGDIINKIKAESSKGYFEKLIKKYIVNNQDGAIIVLKPQKGLQDKKDQEQKQKLQAYKNSLSQAAVKGIVEDTKTLLNWKNEPDSKSAIATLPTLGLKDLDIHFNDTPTKAEDIDGAKVLYHNLPSNGVAYANFYFDFSKLPQDKYKYMLLLTSFLGNVDTKNQDYLALSDAMNTYTDGVTLFSPSIGIKYNQKDQYLFKVATPLAMLDDNVVPATRLFSQIINDTTFDNKKRIKSLLDQYVAALDLVYQDGGSLLCATQMNQYISDAAKLRDELNGPKLYAFIKDLDKNFDSKWNDVKAELEAVRKIIFNKNNLVVSFTGDNKAYEAFKAPLNDVIATLNTKEYSTPSYKLSQPGKNGAIVTSEKIVNVFKGGTFKGSGYSYNPKLQVLAKILNSDYLWNKVRVNGGAYGSAVEINQNGIVFSSWDDPNLEETLKTYDGAVEYIKNFKATKEEMQNYIIGAIGNANDDSFDPMTKGAVADSMYLSGQTKEDFINDYKEMLTTTDQDIRAYAKVLEALLSQNCYYVAGNGDIINKNPKLFESIQTISEILK